MKTSRNGILFIARREALVLVSYQDGPHMSIGFGSNDPMIEPGDMITVPDAFARLVKDVRTREPAVRKALDAEVEQHQFDALMSAYYQGGNRNLLPLAALVNIDRADCASFLFPFLNRNLAGEALPGLTRRRHFERAVFDRADYGVLSPLPLWHGDPKTTQPESYHVKDEDLPL